MNKRYYFLSIFILFLININFVNAAELGLSNFYVSVGSNPDQVILPYNSLREVTQNSNIYFHFTRNDDTADKNYSQYYISFKLYTFVDRNFTFTPSSRVSNFKINTYTSGSYRYYDVSFYSQVPTFADNSTTGIAINFASYSFTGGSTSYLAFYDYKVSYVGSNEYNSQIIIEQNEKINNNLNDLNDKQEQTNDKLDNLNDNITDSDSSEATGEAGDFFSNFNTDTFGLTSVITAPLQLIESITSKTCTPLQGTLPFVSTDVNIPCLSTIYETHFGSFLTIYRTITFGFVAYWVCVKIFNLVKDFKNPEHDEIEVLDL